LRTLLLLTMLLFAAGCALQPVATRTIPPSAPTATDKELINNQGGYRIAIPPTAIVYQDQKPSVDGVLTPLTDTVVLQTEEYTFALTHFVLKTEIPVAQFIDEVSQCMMVSSDRAQPLIVGGIDYQSFPDAPCGPSGISFFYTVVDGRGYRISVEANSPYQTIAEEIETILASFVPTVAVGTQSGATALPTAVEVAAVQPTDCPLPQPVQLAIDRHPTATLAEMTAAVELSWMVLSTIHRVNIMAVPGSEAFGQPLLVVQWTGPIINEATPTPSTLSLLWRTEGAWQQRTICTVGTPVSE